MLEGAGLALACVLVPASRVVLGYHSAEQVAAGAVAGVCSAAVLYNAAAGLRWMRASSSAGWLLGINDAPTWRAWTALHTAPQPERPAKPVGVSQVELPTAHVPEGVPAGGKRSYATAVKTTGSRKLS